MIMDLCQLTIAQASAMRQGVTHSVWLLPHWCIPRLQILGELHILRCGGLTPVHSVHRDILWDASQEASNAHLDGTLRAVS